MANHALTDRMQQHLQQQTNNNTLSMADLHGDHYKMAAGGTNSSGSNSIRADKYGNNNTTVSMQNMANLNGKPYQAN